MVAGSVTITVTKTTKRKVPKVASNSADTTPPESKHGSKTTDKAKNQGTTRARKAATYNEDEPNSVNDQDEAIAATANARKTSTRSLKRGKRDEEAEVVEGEERMGKRKQRHREILIMNASSNTGQDTLSASHGDEQADASNELPTKKGRKGVDKKKDGQDMVTIEEVSTATYHCKK